MFSCQRQVGRVTGLAVAAVCILACVNANATPLQNGLISYWPLSEGSGLVAHDMAPSGSVADNGELRTAPAWINGIFNAGLQFTGTEDVLIPNSVDMDINSNAMTLSAWVKLDKLPGDASLPSFSGIVDSATDNYNLYLDRGNSELRFKVTDNNSPTGVTTGAHPGIPASMLNTSDWQHVMGVYDGSQGSVRIYLNGNLVDLGSMPTVVQAVRTGQVTGLGSAPAATTPFAPSNLFEGAISDVAIWNRALGGSEAQYLYNSGVGNAVGAANPDIAPLPPITPAPLSSQPVIYYRLDGDLKNYGTGGAALDATFHDGPDASGPQFAASQVGQGLDLRGNPTATNSTTDNGDYLSVDYVLTDKGTISLNFQDMTWFNFNSLWSNSVHNNDWEAWIYGDGRLASRANDSSGNNNLDFFLPLLGPDAASAPHNVVFTWDRDGTKSANKIYVDGVLREQYVETWNDPGSKFFIGGGVASNGANHLGKGIFDEVRIYDVVLSDREVLTLAQIPEPASVLIAFGFTVLGCWIRTKRS